MLDFVSIFTKGGILLWCYQGAGLLEDELRSFRARVNAFVNDVLLQEMTGGGGKKGSSNLYESGSLALKYRLDNEFELVFIAAYQKVLPLLYLDKLLDEIQLRFRDRYQQDLKVSRPVWKQHLFIASFPKSILCVIKILFRAVNRLNCQLSFVSFSLLQESNFFRSFASFTPEFDRTLQHVEAESKVRP